MRLLSIIMPVYNESGTVATAVERSLVADVSGLELEVIVVDDASTDGSLQEVRRLAQQHPAVRLLEHPHNRGKGAALRTGIEASRGDIVLIQDANLEYDPRDYPALLAPILEGKADVVYGSRFAGGESHRVLYYWHSFGNRVLTTVSNMFTDLNLSDMETGYKVFRGELLRGLQLQEERFGIEPELTAKVARLRCRVYEVGVHYYGRTYAEGKKITWRDGVRALWCILKYR